MEYENLKYHSDWARPSHEMKKKKKKLCPKDKILIIHHFLAEVTLKQFTFPFLNLPWSSVICDIAPPCKQMCNEN